MASMNIFLDGDYYAGNGAYKVYHQGNPPTALEVGAASVDRVNTLEATITALLARIEALEAINNTPTA